MIQYSGSSPCLIRILKAAAIICFCCLPTACISLLPDKQPSQIFLFEVSFPEIEEHEKGTMGSLTIAVNQPTAAPGYDTEQMVYARQPGEIEYFSLNRWADSPAAMLQPLLVQALDRDGFFQTVVQSPSYIKTDITIDTELLKLRQFFPVAGESFIELVLRIQVLYKDEVLAGKTFTKSLSTFSSDPKGGVNAVNQLLEKVLPDVATYCAKATEKIK